MTRKITINLPDDVDHWKYADIAHGVWMLLQIANMTDEGWVEADNVQTRSQLAQRWDDYKRAPWQST